VGLIYRLINYGLIVKVIHR